MDVNMGQVMKVRLSRYLVLLSADSKTRWQDSHTFKSDSCNFQIHISDGCLEKISNNKESCHKTRRLSLTCICLSMALASSTAWRWAWILFSSANLIWFAATLFSPNSSWAWWHKIQRYWQIVLSKIKTCISFINTNGADSWNNGRFPNRTLYLQNIPTCHWYHSYTAGCSLL